jgi:hypothetical protein
MRIARVHVRGARPLGRGVRIGPRHRRGRLIYGLGRRRVRFVSVVSRRLVRHPRALKRHLRQARLLHR